MQRIAGLVLAVLGIALFGCGGDDGAGPPVVVGDGGVGGGDGATPPPKHAFVTSTEFTADFGTVEKADSACTTRASAAGLSGTYRAWLSDSTSSPSTRFTHSEGKYISVGGTVIADGWAGLTSGSLKATLDYDENDEKVELGMGAWTGTAADGTATEYNCNDWTGSGQATLGAITAYGYKWSALPNPAPCTGFQHLYCFEQ